MEKRRGRADYSENLLKELSCDNLANFYERSKKELQDFLDFFNLDKDERINEELRDPNCRHQGKAIVFTEICYLSRITIEEAYKFQKFLLKRIK